MEGERRCCRSHLACCSSARLATGARSLAAMKLCDPLVMTVSDAELESLAYDLESDLVERKESFSDPDRVSQAVCAFANDLPDHRQPGHIVIGVWDNGSPTHRLA